MKRITAILFIHSMLILIFAVPQTTQAASVIPGYEGYQSPKLTNGSSWTWTNSVGSDNQGNSYLVGNFGGTVNFNPNGISDNHTSTASSDVYVTKYDKEGNYSWTKTFGGTGYDIANVIAIDFSGNVYLAGLFQNTVNFNSAGPSDQHTSNGADDVFLTKFDNEGSYEWTRTFGNGSYDVVNGVDVGSDGSIYLVGSFGTTVNFNSAGPSDEKTSNGGSDVYITKFNDDGNYVWTKSFGGNSEDYAIDIAINEDNDIYLTGAYSNTVNFNPSGLADQNTSNGQQDTFITKLNSDGSYGWTKTFGSSSGSDASESLAVSQDGSIYVAGFYVGTTNFNPHGTADIRNTNGGRDIYITKLNSDGSYGWTRTFGNSVNDSTTGIAVSPSGSIHATGTFSGTLDFDPTESEDNFVSSDDDIYVTSYLPDGSYQWTKVIMGNFYDDDAYYSSVSITVSNLFMGVNTCSSTIDLDPFEGEEILAEPFQSSSCLAILVKLGLDYRFHITNLIYGLKLTSTDGLYSATDLDDGIPSSDNSTLRLSNSNNNPIADVVTDMTSDRDWNTLSAGTDVSAGKSFAHNLTNQPGASNDFTLYIPKLSDHTYALICPGAQTLDEVTQYCSGGYTLSESDSNLSIETIDHQQYFKVSGLTGTGGMSTNQALADTGLNQILILLASTLALAIGAYQIRRLKA